MNICFFRHGLAIPNGTAGIDDDLRPLTEDGRKRTRQAARGLARLRLGLDVILSSPLPRSVQSAEILSEVLSLPRATLTERLLPTTTGPQILELLKETTANAPVLIGHEPSLSNAVETFISATNADSLELKKAGMAYARLKALTPRPRGTLLLLMTPGALRRIGR